MTILHTVLNILQIFALLISPFTVKWTFNWALDADKEWKFVFWLIIFLGNAFTLFELILLVSKAVFAHS